MVIRCLQLIALGALCLFNIALASVTSVVSQTEVYMDESFILTVSVTPIQSLNDRDLQALQRLFDVEQQLNQQKTQIIQGKLTSRIDYQFRLRPKQIGTLGIPNFRVGNEQSQPIFIKVLDPAGRPDSLAADSVILSAQLSKLDPYLDEPFQLTVELAYKIQLKGSILSYNVDEFDVQLIDEEQTTTTIDNQPYNLFRQTLSLTPKQPGSYALPDIVFSGEYPDHTRGQYVKISRRTSLPNLLVRSIPATFPKNAFWLPLKELSLTDNLDDLNELQQGDHLEWKVTSTTLGLSASRLPDPLADLENSLDSGIRLYRNPPSISGQTRVDSAALTANKPGRFYLPAIRIPWWNTQTDTLQWAELKQRRLIITSTRSPSSITTTDSLKSDLSRSTKAELGDTPVSLNDSDSATRWKVLLGMTLAGWAITALAAVYWIKRPHIGTPLSPQHARNQAPLEPKPLQSTEAVYQFILKQLALRNLSSRSLSERLSETEYQQWKQLERSLFKPAQTPMDVQEAKKLAKRIQKKIDLDETLAKKASIRLYPES